jgi:hypothetical protein
MTARTLRLGRVRRLTSAGDADEICLEPGVNVIVGLKDTGKTGWLHTISFLLGDTDGPEKSLGPALASKFDSASVQLLVDGKEEITLERRWKEQGAKHKVFIDGDPIRSEDFSTWMLAKLGIPSLRFPKGNPYSGATWPELAWRMLFRHVFREERFWSDLADKQPDREQHACLLQFLGGAENLYPKALADGVSAREELLKLRARREQFDDVFQQAAKGLLADSTISDTPTHDVIGQGVQRIRAEIALLLRDREDLVVSSLEHRARKPNENLPEEARLSEQRLHLMAERDRANEDRLATDRRLDELLTHKNATRAELTRMTRAAVAGELFRPLSVTRCPNCDQRVTPESAGPGSCFVCHQHLPPERSADWFGAGKRITFERGQLEAEDHELEDLLRQIREQQTAASRRVGDLDSQIAATDVLLRPARAAVAAILPPSLGILDTKIGQLEERAAQLLRLDEAIGQRDKLSRDIDALAVKVQSIADDVDTKSATIPFEQLADAISDGINEYLHFLNQGDAARWTHGTVRLRLGETSFKLLVGGRPWQTVVGATSTALVVLGYQYALLRLSAHDNYNYPGFALIDFPMTLADAATIAGKENYLVEPFVALANGTQAVQVVFCGRAFKALKGVNRITLDEVWTQSEGAPDNVADGDSSPGGVEAQPAIVTVGGSSAVSSPGLALTLAAHFHSNKTQIMMVLDTKDVKKLATVVPELGAALEANLTWPGKEVRVAWQGGTFVAKLVHHIDNGNVKFTVRKRSALGLWQYLDALLRTDHPAREFPARYSVAAGNATDEFFVEVSVPPKA